MGLVSTTGLVYYGISAVVIVAGIWFLVKFPLFPTEEEMEEWKDESQWFV